MQCVQYDAEASQWIGTTRLGRIALFREPVNVARRSAALVVSLKPGEDSCAHY